MINITAPGKAHIIRCNVSNLGVLRALIISADRDNSKEKLVENGVASRIIISASDIKPQDYQNNLTSVEMNIGKVNHSLHINYLSGTKGTSGKFVVQDTISQQV
jgi:hypothetical protein